MTNIHCDGRCDDRGCRGHDVLGFRDDPSGAADRDELLAALFSEVERLRDVREREAMETMIREGMSALCRELCRAGYSFPRIFWYGTREIPLNSGSPYRDLRSVRVVQPTEDDAVVEYLDSHDAMGAEKWCAIDGDRATRNDILEAAGWFKWRDAQKETT